MGEWGMSANGELSRSLVLPWNAVCMTINLATALVAKYIIIISSQ